MKLCISCVAAVLAVSGAAAYSLTGSVASAETARPAAVKETYTVDTGHSSVIFKAKHNNVANFYGRFDEATGSFSLEDGGSVNVSIKADSVHSGISKRDDHLRNTDFFSAKEFPTIDFKSSSVKAKGTDEFEVAGELTFRGVTKPLTVTVKNTGTGESRGAKVAGMETKFTIKRSEFGSTYGIPAVSDEVELIVSLEGMAK